MERKEERYPAKVQEVLDHLVAHPITIKSQKMLYLPLSELDPGRLPDVLEGLDRDQVVLEALQNGSRVHKERGELTMQEEHVADVVRALLYLSCGGMDEAHDLVLPYSWSGYTELSGQPMLNSAIASEASYCHALVHRKEGEYIGELGMVGWSNACFWFGQTGRHSLQNDLKNFVNQAIEKSGSGVKQSVMATMPGLNKGWSTDAFTSLCKKANKSKDEKLQEFCNEVYRTEWQMLLDQCYAILNKH